ncbi:MAG: radical SAM protein [Acidimicrobiia bacterium]|nr:radical SAM protein [Acidimicrobiia bacterium]
MSATPDLDCVLIGYNDVDLQWVDEELKPLRHASGGYRHFRANTVCLDGDRIHFTELLNRTLADATGRHPGLHVARTPSLACCILKSFLAHRGLRAEIVNFFNTDRDRLIDLLAQKPRAVAITTTVYTTARPIIDIVECIRRYDADTTIIVGGPHIYNVCSDHDVETRDFLLQEMGADVYVFDSQGELTLSAVVAALRSAKPDLSAVPNLIYDGDGVTFTQTRRLPENNPLDETNIDWPLFDPDYITPFAWMRTARSCAYNCAFCRYPALGGALVLNDVEVVERQLQFLAGEGLKHLYFIDDTFNVPLPRFKDLCRMMIRNRFDFTWTSYFRCSNADEETFDLIKAAGCVAVFAGIESGDARVLKNMNKKALVQTYRNGLRMLAERDIAAYASFIIGFPGETAESVQHTIDFIQETAPTFYSAEAYFHDPKVPVQERAAEFGLLGAGYSWTHATMDWEEAQAHVERLHRSVDRSVLLPLYGMDVWSVPYFEANGVSRGQLVDFLRAAQAMVVRSFDEDRPDYTAERARLRDALAPPVNA